MSKKDRNTIYKRDADFWKKWTFGIIAFVILLTGLFGFTQTTSAEEVDSSVWGNSVHQQVIESLEYIHSKQIECVFEHSFNYIRYFNEDRLEYLVGYDSDNLFTDGYTYEWLFGETRGSFMILAIPDDSNELGFMVAEIPEDLNYQNFLIANQEPDVYAIALYDSEPIVPYAFDNLMFGYQDINSFSFTELHRVDGLMLGSICANNYGRFVLTNYVPSIGSTTEEVLNTNSIISSFSRAKGTLRSLGSSELAYMSTNDEKAYGTFEQLQEDLYIASGYTPQNMMLNYELHIYCGGSMHDAWFVIIAIPTIDHAWLDVLIITEDQVVRRIDPGFLVGDLIEYPEYLRGVVSVSEPVDVTVVY